MNYEKIVALFDTPEHAEAARRNLETAGFPAGQLSLVSNKTLTTAGQALREPGMWHRLFGRDIEQHEATVYGRTVEAGGVVLTLRVPETDTPRAMGILNAHKVVDVQNRAVEHGLISAAAAAAVAPPVIKSPMAATIASAVSKEQVLRLAEEQLVVGKKMVEDGTTRIRRFVTEKPVEAQVTLHEEHAQVVRRAVSDPNFVKDIDWSDQTIEVTETAEQAVPDTVRRQQVEVERDRVPSSGSSTRAKKTG